MTIDHFTLIWVLRLMFCCLFFKEIYYTPFRIKKSKIMWFLIIFIFTFIGYSLFLAYKRKITIKRKFCPDFAIKNNS